MIKTIIAEIKKLGIPVRYRNFKTPPPIPFAVYYEDESNNFSADNVVYQKRINYVLEFYNKEKDQKTEERIEKIFDQNEVYWEKEEMYIESEKLLMTAFYFTL